MSAAPPRRPAPSLLDQLHAEEMARGFIQIIDPFPEIPSPPAQGAAPQPEESK